MTAWTTVNASQIVPAGLVSAINTMAGLLETALTALKTSADLGSRIPPLPSLPSGTATVVNAILDSIQGLLKAGRIHMLVIPIAKTVPRPTPPLIPPTLEDLQATMEITLGPTTQVASDAYADIVARSGGNAGFYAAFAESLMDLQDPNRPQYEAQHDAVMMTTLLVGAPSFASIVSAASTIEMLVRPKGSAGSMTARTVPIPQNLRARPVAAVTGKSVGVRLDWDPPLDAFQARYFPGVTITVKRYAVIRSTSAKIQSARSVLDLFSTQSLVEGLSEGDHKVVAVGSGLNAAYLDDGAALSITYYYAVAWECAIVESDATAVLPFDRLSNVTKVDVKTPPPAQTGTSPDWVATGSAIEAFPSLATAAQRLIEEARVLLAPSSSPKQRLADALKLMTDTSARVSARSSDLLADVKRLSAALSRTIPSLHVTQMVSASGGNAYLLAELAARLNDPTDPTRPPFDHGEYVCGVCFVAGASRLADLAAAIAFFDALFGPATASNPLLGVLTAIDTLVTQAETVVFQPDMTPVAPGLTSTVDPLTGLPPVPTTPVIADDGVPVASTDPANPEAGDTNITPLSDLC